MHIIQKIMKTIGRASENMGGIVTVWAIPLLQITLNGNRVTLGDTDQLFELQVTQESSGAKVNQKTDFSGTTFTHEISGFISGSDADAESYLAQMIRIKKFVVIARDSLGNFILYGRPQIPLRFCANFDTGETTASKRGFDFKFSGNVRYGPITLSESPFD